jgi:SpoVK/Ycf46/Vps4 family AAA+-type ATPase
MTSESFFMLDSDGDYKLGAVDKKTLPAGAYRARGNYLTPVTLSADNFIRLPGEPSRVYELLENFVKGSNKDRFKGLGLLYRVNVLLYGIPGTGKTALLMDVACKAIEELGWVVLLVENAPAGAELCRASIAAIRAVEPSRPLIVMWEELDAFASVQETGIMELLDGKDQQADVMFLMSTNFVQNIPKRILLRCRRIPYLIEFKAATEEQRQCFFDVKLTSILPEYWAHTNKEDLMRFSEGMTVDQCVQMVMDVVVLGKTPIQINEEIYSREKLLADSPESTKPSPENGKGQEMRVTFVGPPAAMHKGN